MLPWHLARPETPPGLLCGLFRLCQQKRLSPLPSLGPLFWWPISECTHTKLSELRLRCGSYYFLLIYWDAHFLSSNRCFRNACIVHSFLLPVAGRSRPSQRFRLSPCPRSPKTVRKVPSGVSTETLVWGSCKNHRLSETVPQI